MNGRQAFALLTLIGLLAAQLAGCRLGAGVGTANSGIPVVSPAQSVPAPAMTVPTDPTVGDICLPEALPPIATEETMRLCILMENHSAEYLHLVFEGKDHLEVIAMEPCAATGGVLQASGSWTLEVGTLSSSGDDIEGRAQAHVDVSDMPVGDLAVIHLKADDTGKIDVDATDTLPDFEFGSLC